MILLSCFYCRPTFVVGTGIFEGCVSVDGSGVFCGGVDRKYKVGCDLCISKYHNNMLAAVRSTTSTPTAVDCHPSFPPEKDSDVPSLFFSASCFLSLSLSL